MVFISSIYCKLILTTICHDLCPNKVNDANIFSCIYSGACIIRNSFEYKILFDWRVVNSKTGICVQRLYRSNRENLDHYFLQIPRRQLAIKYSNKFTHDSAALILFVSS